MDIKPEICSVNKALSCMALMCCTVFPVNPAFAGGDRYAAEGSRLSAAIVKNLVEKNICQADSPDCWKKIRFYGGHGNKVNYSVYAPDKKALAATFAFVVEKGTEITGGVPISITVYPRSRESYGNIIFSPNPIISLEVSK